MDEIRLLEYEIAKMRKILYEKENRLYELKKKWILQPNPKMETHEPEHNAGSKVALGDKLPKWAIERYSRQILLSDIGAEGQVKICTARVLVVGAGGLGCPVSSYLAGAGVGEIGIVDYDSVDVTNIHRQLLHSEQDQGMSKVESAANALRRINSHITITPYNVQLDSKNALDVISKYDIVLDCTDNVPTRYLLNDACVLLKVPLVSGSALKMEGQLTIYNYMADKNDKEKDGSYAGPCYRCLFDTPPPPETVGSCSANGVCGPVPAVIGCLQALEAIKLIVGFTHPNMLVGRLLIFDGESMSFRVVKLRVKSPTCDACSAQPTITQLLDYETFCRSKAKEQKNKEKQPPMKYKRRKEAKLDRMRGKSYFGCRKASLTEENNRKWLQDVPKEGKTLGPRCKSAKCANKQCNLIDGCTRKKIFSQFWNDFDWHAKKKYVRSLVDVVTPHCRRPGRTKECSRIGKSRLFYLLNGEGKNIEVCRVMFMNTLGIGDGQLRSWLSAEKPTEPKKKKAKNPVKASSVYTFLDDFPKAPPKCLICSKSSMKLYYYCDGVKNQFQLFKRYCAAMTTKGEKPASRKTFDNVYHNKGYSFFRPKNKDDVCDLDLDLKILDPHNRITPAELAVKLKGLGEQRHLLVDVRSASEFNMCRIDGAVNYPIDTLDRLEEFDRLLNQIMGCNSQVTFVCRRGNDSQLVTQRVLDALDNADDAARIKDLTGGLHAWSKDVDDQFPVY